MSAANPEQDHALVIPRSDVLPSADVLNEAVLETLRRLAQRGVITIHGELKPAKVLEEHGVTGPEHVEVAGYAYKRLSEREQGRLHTRLERNRHWGRLRAVLDGEALGVFNAMLSLEWDLERDERVDALRTMGQTLIDEGAAALWKVVYLKLRERGRLSDAIMHVIGRDAYHEGDECLFALGERWRSYVKNLAGQPAHRDRLDVESKS